jgi:hypothetical protein
MTHQSHMPPKPHALKATCPPCRPTSHSMWVPRHMRTAANLQSKKPQKATCSTKLAQVMHSNIKPHIHYQRQETQRQTICSEHELRYSRSLSTSETAPAHSWAPKNVLEPLYGVAIKACTATLRVAAWLLLQHQGVPLQGTLRCNVINNTQASVEHISNGCPHTQPRTGEPVDLYPVEEERHSRIASKTAACAPLLVAPLPAHAHCL